MTLEELREDLRELRQENHNEHIQLIELVGVLKERTSILETNWSHTKWVLGFVIPAIVTLGVESIIRLAS